MRAKQVDQYKIRSCIKYEQKAGVTLGFFDTLLYMNISKRNLIVFSTIFALILVGSGCSDLSDFQFPPKPPVPGIQQSPVIDRLTP